MSKRLNLVGQRFGRLVVKSFSHISNNHACWLCLCDCGNTHVTVGARLKNGGTKSCGCLSRELTRKRQPGFKHGKCCTSIYNAWVAMIKRCEKPTAHNYARYGGRGIKVCERWHTFENFLADMGEKPSPSHSLDRIDNDGNYEPSNCRWATTCEQANNTSSNHIVTINNESHTIAEWAKITNVNRKLISLRIRKGWNFRDAVFIPARHYK